MGSLQLESWLWLGVGAAVALLIAVVAWRRWFHTSAIGWALMLAGMLLVAGAMGGVVWRATTAGKMVVMVDLSPSTRSAVYRNGAALRQRINMLVGAHPHSILFFAGHNQGTTSIPDGQLADMPSRQTVYDPPEDASRVLLFSDARFRMPAVAPPTYIVVDPGMESPSDGAVERIDASEDGVVRSVIRNNDQPRVMTIGVEGRMFERTVSEGVFQFVDGGEDEGGTSNSRSTEATPPGNNIVVTLMPPRTHSARGSDLWPENDRLESPIPPAEVAERWWISADAARHPPGWVVMSPSQLPTEAAAYLNAGVIVLDNIPADAIGATRTDRLTQYVRDLGGSLLILGGDHAFGAGGYDRTALGDLSPLASQPPTPAMRWFLLVDSSGSMSASVSASGGTRWNAAATAMTSLLATLPPHDLVSMGNFAQSIRWWTTNQPIADIVPGALPPADVQPGGPTNLQAALQQVITQAPSEQTTQLMLITDGEAPLASTSQLIADMRRKKIRLSILAIGSGEAIPALRAIASATGGMTRTELDASQWASAARNLARAGVPSHLVHEDIEVRFEKGAASLASLKVPAWNRTWAKANATPWASGGDANDALVLGTHWRVGAGQVTAFGFSPDEVLANELAGLVRTPARDPRLKVEWTIGSTVGVSVRGIANGRFVNGLALSLDLQAMADAPSDGRPTGMALKQTAPGEYDVRFDAPERDTLATVRLGHATVDRRVIPARYPREYDRIGNDHAAMSTLAGQTGGRVIGVREISPLDPPLRHHRIGLDAWLAALGALSLAGGTLLLVRRQGNAPFPA